MTTQELANYIAPFLAPAQQIVRTANARIVEMTGGPETGSPLCLPSDLNRIAELKSSQPMLQVIDTTYPATAASPAELEQKFSQPNKRTYYLGACGRVSQRKHLVGEIIATVRACNTEQARFLFTEAQVVEVKPFIGKPKSEKWHCPTCGRDFLGPINSIAYPGQNICPGRGCYSRNIERVS